MTSSVRAGAGEGTIGRGTAWFLMLAFLAVIAAPLAWEPASGGIPAILVALPGDWRQDGFQRALQALEVRFDRRSEFALAVRLPYRSFLLRWFGHSPGNAVPGRDGFLFYRPDLEYAAGPGPLSARARAGLAEARDVRRDAFEETVDAAFRRLRGLPAEPRPPVPDYVDATTAIRDAVRQFRARGLAVVLAPLPGKVTVYPELFAPGYASANGAAQHPGLLRLQETWAADGIPVVDVGRALWDAKGRSDRALFLKTDSHWSPEGLTVAADAIAARAGELFRPARRVAFPAETVTEPFYSDMRVLFDAGPIADLYPKETITKTRVLHGDGPAVIGDDAPVLLIGDSFTVIYSELGEGASAALPAQLMLRLGCGVQTLAAIGALPSDRLPELAKRPGMLAKKKLVIWTFVDRAVDNPKAWKRVVLPPP